jgi:glycine/D-amino acid oxidase-like deaminating enzyme
MTELARHNGDVSFWYANTSMPRPRAPLPGGRSVEVCVVGAGFTGLWTAYYLKRAVPEMDVAVLEREFAGFGASGRNGGWLSSDFATPRAAMARSHGRDGVLALQRAMRATVDEVISVCEREQINADIVKHGMIRAARNPAQVVRQRRELAEARSWGLGPEDLAELDVSSLARRIRIAGGLAGTWTPHAARVQPAKLVQGLAAAVERLGVPIYEGTTVTEITPGTAHTDRGAVRARFVLSCLEGFTPGVRGQHRTLLPLNSAMIVTEPLTGSTWEAIGWERAELLGDMAHAYMYSQRTADGRIALGGRGVPYRFGSRTDYCGQTQERTVRQLIAVLHSMFPAVAGTPIDHAWCGVLGVPRDWSPMVRLDPVTGVGIAGGYVGSGVSTTNLAARTLRDLVLGHDTELTRLPWVGHTTRRWEPEPLRWLGAQLVYSLYRAADRREAAADGAQTASLARLATLLAGR